MFSIVHSTYALGLSIQAVPLTLLLPKVQNALDFLLSATSPLVCIASSFSRLIASLLFELIL